jgi:alpha-L-fucosidase
VFDWPAGGQLRIPSTAGAIKAAYLLSNRGTPIAVAQNGDTITIHGPASAPDPVASVVVLEK